MTTLAPSNILAQDTNAHFQAWVTEVVNALFTSLGVTQTSDTGQINPATATIPSINTAAGYVIGRFNDTLQATAPVFFKLEFGAGAAVGDPQMWITVGTGSNGSGTITNGGGAAVGTRMAVLNGTNAPFSLTTAFTSRYVYLGTTQCGLLAVMFKYGGQPGGSINANLGSFFIFRTSDSSGNASAAAICVIASSSTGTGTGGTDVSGFAQFLSFANSAAIPATPALGWESIPNTTANFILGLTTTLESSTAFVAPVYTYDPVIRYSAYLATALIADFAVAATSSFAIVGSTPMTMISAGMPFGGANGFNNASNFTTRSLVVPWQ